MNQNPTELNGFIQSWENDLFYYQHEPHKLKGIKAVFKSVWIICSQIVTRDFLIAKKHGFKGEYLGTFPGGGGLCYFNLFRSFG